MWIMLADQNVFSTTLGQILVMISIPTHYALGFLLVRAIRRASTLRRSTRLLREPSCPTVPNPDR
jgi:hypothetical protein